MWTAFMPEYLIGTNELAELLGKTQRQAMYFAKSAPKTVLVGNSYIIPLDIARGQVLIDLEQEQSQRRFLSNSLAQLPDPDADETYTAADLGRLLSITRQGATRLV